MPAQIARANGHPASRSSNAPRPALVEGIFLTHAHMGHYTGLMHLGREAYSAKTVPVYGTERMRTFLRDNGPWSQLVSLKNITLHELHNDQAISLSDGLEVTPMPVVHRDEFSDTVAFVITGPQRKLLYLPDIDKWSRWDRSIEELIASVDVALIDGTFFAEGEIPGRAMSEIPHPFIMESLKRFAELPDTERAKVIFTHLNHSNPAANPNGEAAAQIKAAGMAVAHDGQLFAL
jgi:pyrroloquinoline quinone biosynthesis protein B